MHTIRVTADPRRRDGMVLSFDLKTAVNRHSWAWLLDLPHRLNVAIELVDDRHVSLLPAETTAAAIRQSITTPGSSLQEAISETERSARPQAVMVVGHQCVCWPLAPAGVLVLGRGIAPEGQTPEECRRDLEVIGGWLGSAIEATITGPPDSARAEGFRMQSLQRLLNEAASRGWMRDVICAFTEAVAVWKELDVRVYAADPNGRFFQHVFLVGADPLAAPAELDDRGVPGDGTTIRLSRPEAERLGFGSFAHDVVVKRISIEGGASWVIVFAGIIDADDEASLTVYADLLRDSLNSVAASATTHLVSGIAKLLLRLYEPIEITAQAALGELTSALGGNQSALVVTTAEGIQALTVGDTELLQVFGRRVPPDRLLITQSSEDGGQMVLAVARDVGRFTAHERDLLEVVARILRIWVHETLERSGISERRSARRPVQELIERLAAEAVEAGGQASVITMSVPERALRPGLMQAWVAKLRGQLRPWDFAGLLTGSEIAVLLRDTAADQAAVVSARLATVLESEASGAGVRPSVGMTTCSAGSPFAGSIVRAARDDAVRRAQA